ncbi:photosystem I reaction center subunit XII [cyanobacterium endosymbiont of Rhopalodia gibberula]|uniref:photosystem I reaction center subunit XII n=1 Tax=cyanobacterium endosymbiont of Rhopalodia gibberula TaxID=1763363 RepID=UPI000E6467B7|nr:photosystem I reaction center subunit XII [cyanobacterium endosymbiont of Rhopalodia gibberula]
MRTQHELQNTYFTKLVPHYKFNFRNNSSSIMRTGSRIVIVKLLTDKQRADNKSTVMVNSY